MGIESEIAELEKSFWQTMIDGDVERASALMAERSVLASGQGVATIGLGRFAQMMAEAKWKLHSFSFSDVTVLQPAPDVAVIGYKVEESITVEGKLLQLNAADTSTWVRQNGEWRCVLHTESVLSDPFGREPG